MTSTTMEPKNMFKTGWDLPAHDEDDWQEEEYVFSADSMQIADHPLSLSAEQLQQLANARPLPQEWFESPQEESPF